MLKAQPRGRPLRPAVFLVVMLGLLAASGPARAQESEGPGGPPFPNDAGPAEINVASYPKNIQDDYRVFSRRCSQCHTLARAVNSQFVQLTPAEQKVARIREPDLFGDAKIWQISDGVWAHYLGRMHAKPGAAFRIRPDESDRILEFLVYDSKARKMGVHRNDWRASRQKLLDLFKKTHPKRYAQLFAGE